MDLEERIGEWIEDLIEIVVTAFVCILSIEILAEIIITVLVEEIDFELSAIVITILTVIIIAYLERDVGFTPEALMEEFGVKGIIGLMIAHLWLGNVEMAVATPILYVFTRVVQDRLRKGP